MDVMCTLRHRFDTLELPSYSRVKAEPRAVPRQQTQLVSDGLSKQPDLQVPTKEYRLSPGEHNALRSALRKSVTIRAVLRRG